jgi:P-type E1-E2 ATPase
MVGDLISVKIGGKVPIDGVVIEGKGTCDEAMLTGESRPVEKIPGSKVFGGTNLKQGNLIVEVKKTSEDSSLNQIMKLVENA